MSPMNKVLSLKMERAEQLLWREHLQIYQVAERVGYNNQFAFSVAFKRQFGMSPREYINTRKNLEKHTK